MLNAFMQVFMCFLFIFYYVFIKAKNHDLYYIWVTKLSAHRMYKRNEAAHVHNSLLQALSHGNNVLQGNGTTQNVVSCEY